jgi:peptidoglycan/xylan/chitin deacetylase (PgdA/CDA1 family)
MNQSTKLEWRVITAIVSATMLAAACASSPKKQESENRAALGKTPLQGRALASQDDPASLSTSLDDELTEEKLSRYFDILFNDQNPSQEILRSLQQTVRIYYRAERELHQFDEELQKAADQGGAGLADLQSYPRMLAYWEISHREQQRIAYVYNRLLEIRTTQPASSEEYKKAHAALNDLAQFVKNAKGADRLALNDLSGELKPIFDHYADQAKKAHQPALKHPFSATLFENGEKISDFAKRPEIQEELSEKARSIETSQSEQSENGAEAAVERLAPLIQNELKIMSDQKGREPQAETLRFFPSSGSHGTISGSEYPKGTWSITFDDGPSGKYSPMVLKNLNDHGFHTTFFELAENIKANPKTSLSLLNAGMEMGNHSYTHPQLPKLDDAHLKHEIAESTAVDVQTWGEAHRPKLFRCPYGAGLTVTRVRDMIAKQGMIHVFWNIDTLDWQDKNPDSILARAKKQMQLAHGGIILFHDIHPQSVEASRMLMDWVKQQGLRQEKVGVMIEELNSAAAPKKAD